MTKEQEILIAAQEEFFRVGYDSASTAVIAKKAGVTHAMVNYYFRSKENLFFKILDDHTHKIMQGLKPLMTSESGVVQVFLDIAAAIFDQMNSDRKFPFLLLDIAKTHPEFLTRYNDVFANTCMQSIEVHSRKLDAYISEGSVSQCSMRDICDTVLTLTFAPFVALPILENVAHMSPAAIDAYLLDRRTEILRIISARYSNSRPARDC